MIDKIDYHTFAVFDIETSTEYDGDGKPTDTWLSYAVFQTFIIFKNNVMPKKTYRCLTWDDVFSAFKEFECSTEFEKIIFVHNLSYEFSYLTGAGLTPTSIVAISSHNPIKCKFEEFPRLQFRCTYQLSLMSLRRMGELVGTPKLESSYRKIPRGENPTDDEWAYCERDTLIPSLYIAKLIDGSDYKLITDLPMTSTGFVRKTFRELMKEHEPECKWDKMPPSDIIDVMEKAFYGGICISNPIYTGVSLSDVYSFDETSAYPYVIMSEMFPKRISKTNQPFNPKGRFIATVKFNNIKSKYCWGWFSVGRADSVRNYRQFNGKLMYADSITVTVCDVDFNNILMTYDFEMYEVIEHYRCFSVSAAPEPYRECVVKYLSRKAELKQSIKADPDNGDLQFNYVRSKSSLNSIYGMCVEKLLRVNWEVNEDGEWIATPDEWSYKEHVGRSFLIGLYITAYARRNLLRGIVKNCPDTFVYADTDSIKSFTKPFKFSNTNVRLISKDPNVRGLGVFDYDGHYETFKTLGAKKYVYTEQDKSGVVTVVAGLPKSKDYGLNSVDEFKSNLYFPKCKIAHKYLPSGCALYEVGYLLDMTENDIEYIEEVKKYEEFKKKEYPNRRLV